MWATPRAPAALVRLRRFEEANSLLCKTIPVARRVIGELHEITIKLLWIHAEMLSKDDSATLADLREAVNTLENSARCARRVYGALHPFMRGFELHIKESREALAARETPGSP